MKKITAVLVASVFIIALSNAQSTLRAKEFNLENGLAIRGYDPVAYFTQNIAVKGAKQFAALVEGVTYYFSTAANRNLFLEDYNKYEPRYGGWCAYAMGANNAKVEIDPETFKIVNGQLFLFYHSWANNTLNKWNKDEANLKAAAEKNWAVIFH